ncbi:hypothetical protein QR680_015255 [Steinernema hermaphroditum]|uniref:Uncharacterized protein n=1 Tax=Steinernema hermaphroditum TaxID=289476 RepID=A0AA39LJX3_9BILA|nr:hypothetical protein QR680_015255 [Steinernema hermaphroditum]
MDTVPSVFCDQVLYVFHILENSDPLLELKTFRWNDARSRQLNHRIELRFFLTKRTNCDKWMYRFVTAERSPIALPGVLKFEDLTGPNWRNYRIQRMDIRDMPGSIIFAYLAGDSGDVQSDDVLNDVRKLPGFVTTKSTLDIRLSEEEAPILESFCNSTFEEISINHIGQESEDFLLRQKSLKRITLDGAWPESFLPQLEELVLGSENITLQTTNTNGIPFKYDFVKKVIKKNIEDPTCFLSLNGKISFEFKRLLCDHDLVTGKRISRKALCIEWQVSNEWILRAGIEIASNFHLRHFYNYPE